MCYVWSASEALHHVFCECGVAKCFWFHILRILGCKYRSAIFTWGTVFWGTLAQQTIFYHQRNSSLTLHVKSFMVYATSSSLQGVKFFSRCYVWMIISSLALWIIWKARCSKIYNAEQTNIVDRVAFLGIIGKYG